MVIYADGRINIGVWGREVTMTPQVSAVLQNLVPIVDNGQTAPDATYNDTHIWGATLGANTVVARSGIGVTATGALVYVAGPALTARSLAESLQRAGAVRAMALDINPEWVTFNFYSHPNPADPAQVSAAKLYPQMQRPADRYLGPTPSPETSSPSHCPHRRPGRARDTGGLHTDRSASIPARAGCQPTPRGSDEI